MHIFYIFQRRRKVLTVNISTQKQPPEVFYKKGVLRNFAEFTEKHLYQRIFLIKLQAWGSATLLKKSLWHRCFPVNFAKFLRKPFLQSTSGRLLLTTTIKLFELFTIITYWNHEKDLYQKVWNKSKV